jgi:hypothetical protein
MPFWRAAVHSVSDRGSPCVQSRRCGERRTVARPTKTASLLVAALAAALALPAGALAVAVERAGLVRRRGPRAVARAPAAQRAGAPANGTFGTPQRISIAFGTTSGARRS